jgi:hypothetical protein
MDYHAVSIITWIEILRIGFSNTWIEILRIGLWNMKPCSKRWIVWIWCYKLATHWNIITSSFINGLFLPVIPVWHFFFLMTSAQYFVGLKLCRHKEKKTNSICKGVVLRTQCKYDVSTFKDHDQFVKKWIMIVNIKFG